MNARASAVPSLKIINCIYIWLWDQHDEGLSSIYGNAVCVPE